VVSHTQNVARRSIACALALAFTAAGCAGHGGSQALPAGQSPSTAPLASSGAFGYDAALVQSAQYAGPAKFGRLAFDVAVRWRDPQGLAAYAKAANDPGSALYRRFLAPAEIADRFLASQADYDAAAAYLRGQGIAVGTWRQRMVLHVTGTQAQLERAFGTTFGIYRKGGETFIAPATRPQVPAGVPIVGSVDIVKRAQRFHHSYVRASGLTNGRTTGFAPQQIAAAFDYTGAYNAGFTGSGITVGIIGTGPVQVQGGGRIGDAEAYKAFYRVTGSSSVSIVATSSIDKVVNGASGFATPPPVTAPCSESSDPNAYPSISPTATCNPEDLEAQLDTEQVAALARDASVQFFLAYNPNDGCAVPNGQACPAGAGYAYQGLAESDQELQTAIDRNSADIVSLSYGEAEFGGVAPAGGTSPPYPFDSSGGGLEPVIFQALAAEGIAVFASSGDAGANECQSTYPAQANDLCASYPATDPNVVAVGGVTTPLDGSGKIVGPLAAWGLQTNLGLGGTGGGVSAYFTQPAYQQGLAGIQGSMRNVPDLSLEADPATGVALLVDADPSLGGAQLGAIGGTSVSAPEMAAMWALVLQACKQTGSCASGASAHPYRLGNPNPLFYTIYKDAAKYAATFSDVTYGNNAQLTYCQGAGATDPVNCPTPASGPPTLAPGYSAGVGYDLDTGIGVPFARNLIRAIVGV
jgi:subtilase family serine protease